MASLLSIIGLPHISGRTPESAPPRSVLPTFEDIVQTRWPFLNGYVYPDGAERSPERVNEALKTVRRIYINASGPRILVDGSQERIGNELFLRLRQSVQHADDRVRNISLLRLTLPPDELGVALSVLTRLGFLSAETRTEIRTRFGHEAAAHTFIDTHWPDFADCVPAMPFLLLQGRQDARDAVARMSDTSRRYGGRIAWTGQGMLQLSFADMPWDTEAPRTVDLADGNLLHERGLQAVAPALESFFRTAFS